MAMKRRSKGRTKAFIFIAILIVAGVLAFCAKDIYAAAQSGEALSAAWRETGSTVLYLAGAGALVGGGLLLANHTNDWGPKFWNFVLPNRKKQKKG